LYAQSVRSDTFAGAPKSLMYQVSNILALAP
jgi:hypothetical protein